MDKLKVTKKLLENYILSNLRNKFGTLPRDHAVNEFEVRIEPKLNIAGRPGRENNYVQTRCRHSFKNI